MIQYIGDLIFDSFWFGEFPNRKIKQFWSKKYHPIEDEL